MFKLLYQVIFTAGVVLILSMANLFYRDVGQIIAPALRAWFFLSEVIIPLGDGRFRRLVNVLNPMMSIHNSYRDVIVRGVVPSWSSIWPGITISVVLLLVAWTLFHYNEFRFAENV